MWDLIHVPIMDEIHSQMKVDDKSEIINIKQLIVCMYIYQLMAYICVCGTDEINLVLVNKNINIIGNAIYLFFY